MEAGEEEAMRLASGDSFGEDELLTHAATMFTIRALTKANARVSRQGLASA
jgi:CRP-like cAMP-binding protein